MAARASLASVPNVRISFKPQPVFRSIEQLAIVPMADNVAGKNGRSVCLHERNVFMQYMRTAK